MKSILFVLALLIRASFGHADEILPIDPKTPLFTIYENHFDPPPKDAQPRTHYGHAGKRLLTVYSLADLLLQADKKGVRVVLTDKDAKTFAEITRKFQYPVLIAGDEVAGVTMHFTASIENGSIMFTDSNYSGDVAQYLRRRFRVKPNSNDFQPAKQ